MQKQKTKNKRLKLSIDCWATSTVAAQQLVSYFVEPVGRCFFFFFLGAWLNKVAFSECKCPKKLTKPVFSECECPKKLTKPGQKSFQKASLQIKSGKELEQGRRFLQKTHQTASKVFQKPLSFGHQTSCIGPFGREGLWNLDLKRVVRKGMWSFLN